jgi:N-formylglutamate amidohydrolase
MTSELDPPIEVLHPDAGALPLVISSPHSGQIYPASLLSELRVPVDRLRCLEDGEIERLFGAHQWKAISNEC